MAISGPQPEKTAKVFRQKWCWRPVVICRFRSVKDDWRNREYFSGNEGKDLQP